MPERDASFVLSAFRITVYPAADLDPEQTEEVLDQVDETIHEALFTLAQRLERRYAVEVVAVDERGAGWIAGGLGVRPELGFAGTWPTVRGQALRPERRSGARRR